jgi:hypothetical protein
MAVARAAPQAGPQPRSRLSIVPLPWRYSIATQGWKQMFFLDPGVLLRGGM